MTHALTTKLAILQQAEYEWPRYRAWIAAHPDAGVIEPKQWTIKLRLLFWITTACSFVMSQDQALRMALLLLSLPQQLIISAMLMIATIKLRYLQSRGLIVVAIAGSYAKTSTKYMIWHILSGKKTVLMTPDSINTPVGIARVILRDLGTKTEVFVVELGEYYPGDIRRLTRFVRPQYKVLTPVGYAHLERFGTVEKLQDGLRELLTTFPNTPAFVAGQDYGNEDIVNAHVTRSGTTFCLRGDDEELFIPLLGKHQAVNVLPALWLAKQMGISAADAKKRLVSLPTVPHRLEPTLLEQGMMILDNGYNSNPQAARESLAVLEEIDGTMKVVITPGFVEMGTAQADANRAFAKEIAQVADLCVIIRGENRDALREGLVEAAFPKKSMYEAEGEVEAMNVIKGDIQPNSVILFENSVPDLHK